MKRTTVLLTLLALAIPAGAQAQSATSPREAAPKNVAPDLTRERTLYVVGYAHLDTQWRWEYPQTIREFIPNTLHHNFALFEKYTHYTFNFSGANRYRMMKEYYPADFATLKKYVAAGRWFPSGSAMEESDANSPSAESLIRQILYGSQVFRREFGKASSEYMLPDSFGFPASLPTILAHMGLKGFSSQKLTWGSAAPVGGPGSPQETPRGVPFNVGWWEGPDGRGIIAALNPGDYVGQILHDLSKSPAPPADPKARPFVDWPARVERNGQVSGLFVDFHYYGTGDQGGAPREDSVKRLEAILTKGTATLPPAPVPGQRQQPLPDDAPKFPVGDGPVRVIAGGAGEMFDAIPAEGVARLPRYKGDLLLTEHSAGSITSQAYMKRWNRKNELLADAAERASVAAEWLGGRAYPRERLLGAWNLVMGGQFHDNLPGTATPKAYEFAWNDQVLALNQFAAVLTSATEAIAGAMDTRGDGTPIVVYNPLNVERQDVVEATVDLAATRAAGLRVIGPDGTQVAGQLVQEAGRAPRVLFLAKAPSAGYAVYRVQAGSRATDVTLKVTESSLENARYRVQVDANGDVSGIFDKRLNRELLSAPARLAFQRHVPGYWPAWNMDWRDQQKPPRGYVSGPAKARIVESGPVRVALEITRETEGSKFVQTIRLAAGDPGNRIEFDNRIDWKIGETALKATFPLTAANPMATYNWDVGAIERGTNHERKYEAPSHQWFDLTDRSGAFGVTVLSDCKNGSDKPDDNTLRLTLIYTPGVNPNARDFADQSTQDWGHHEITYGLAAHAGDWRAGQTDWHAHRLNQPLIAFESAKHAGPLGKSFSLVKINNPRVRVLALKKAEESDEVVIRLTEIDGKGAPGTRVSFAAPVVAAREVTGQEMPLRAASTENGELVADLVPYDLRAYAVKLAPATAKVAPTNSHPVPLIYDRNVASRDGAKSNGGFDSAGRAIPAEMLPGEIWHGGIRFALAPAGGPNAVTARGQTIALPAGKHTRAYILAASAEGDQKAAFQIGGKPVELTIQDRSGYIGQWDNRGWTTRQEQIPPRPGAPPGTPPLTRTVSEFNGQLAPGYIKRAPVAWFASHRHTAEGANEPYAFSYLFAYEVELPAGARSLTLPANDKLRVLAITVSDETAATRPAQPLYDTLERPLR